MAEPNVILHNPQADTREQDLIARVQRGENESSTSSSGLTSVAFSRQRSRSCATRRMRKTWCRKRC